MMRLADLAGRIPRGLLFTAVALIQVALIAMMVMDRVRILQGGTEVTLATRPVDPRDFLRGDYVVLDYDISTVPAGDFGAARDSSKDRGSVVYVKLAPKDGVYAAVSAHRAPVEVAAGEVLIRGRVRGRADCAPAQPTGCSSLRVKYGIERYFVPEGEGRGLEAARDGRKLTIVAAVARDGSAAIKRLLVDGRSVYDEPMY